MRIVLPCGAEANVSADIKPETVEALDETMRAVQSYYAKDLPMPTTEESVAWAEEAMAIADVLRQLSDRFNGVDNGHCTICHQHRLYNTRSKVQPCENAECLSHRISEILDQYEKPSEATLERIRRNCLKRLTHT